MSIGAVILVAIVSALVGAFIGARTVVRRLRTTAGRKKYGVRMVINNPPAENAGLAVLPSDDRQRMDAVIPNGIKTLAEGVRHG